MDHFSRRIMGFAVFKYPPSSLQIRSFLTRSFRLRQVFLRRSSSYGGQVAGHVHVTGHVPKYIISDKGSQFWNYAFKQWCKRRKVIPRFGAVGRYGSIALIERCIRSMKAEYARQIILPLRQSDMRYELGLYINWYNEIRPHQSLDGRTPQEIYDGFPVSQQKHEIRGKNGVKLKLSVSYFKGRKHLPVVNLEKAAWFHPVSWSTFPRKPIVYSEPEFPLFCSKLWRLICHFPLFSPSVHHLKIGLFLRKNSLDYYSLS